MDHFSYHRSGSVRWYLLGTLIAVEMLMSFSFLGYLHIEPISITIAYIPVLLGGALMGPLESAALGTLFGLSSMWKASASYVMASDQLFSPLFSIKPLASILLSVGSRMVFGLLVGLLYSWTRRLRHPGVGIAMISYLGKPLHALMVYSALALLFPEAGYHPSAAISSLTGLTDTAANLITAVIVLVFWRIQHSQAWRQFRTRVEMVRSLHWGERYHHLSLIVIIILMLCSSIAVAFYFVHRIGYVLDQKGIMLSEAGYTDLLHLQIQFVIGMLSMMALVIVFLILNRRYATYMSYEAKMDALTGAMTRKTFFQACSRVLGTPLLQTDQMRYFIMADLDWFKQINDTYGHPEGDRALKEVVRSIREILGQESLIGRIGGDEFAVLLDNPTTPEELEINLRHLLDRIHRISWKHHQASCSIGALPITAAQSVEELYREADRLLYQAKKLGRDQFVIGGSAASVPPGTSFPEQ